MSMPGRRAGDGRVDPYAHAAPPLRVVEWCLGIVAVALVGLYLVAFYQTFGMDLALQQQGRVAEELTRQTQRMELELQAKKGAIAINHADLFSAMEKISAITYLEPESVAMVRVEPHP